MNSQRSGDGRWVMSLHSDESGQLLVCYLKSRQARLNQPAWASYHGVEQKPIVSLFSNGKTVLSPAHSLSTGKYT